MYLEIVSLIQMVIVQKMVLENYHPIKHVNLLEIPKIIEEKEKNIALIIIIVIMVIISPK